MIKLKHFMDAAEEDDGIRIWVEPFALTRDLRQWCRVDYMLSSQITPPRPIWDWFESHPGGYEYFRGRYHEYLAGSGLKRALQELVNLANRANITLLYQGSDPTQNSATALYEFLSELTAYRLPDL